MKARLITTNRLTLAGQDGFVRAAATMLSGSRPCPITTRFEPSLAKRDAFGHEDRVQPGEGIVDA